MNPLNIHTDIILEIFKYLPVEKLYEFRIVCTHWNSLLKSSFIWQYIYETQFGYPKDKNICYETNVIDCMRIIKKLSDINKAIFAIRNNHVNLLIQMMRRINLYDLNITNPIHMASEYGHVACLEAILAVKANWDMSSKNRCTALCIASQNGHTDIIRILDKMCINEIAHNGCASLYMACQNGHIPTVKYLLEVGADPNILYKGYSCLYISCQKGYLDIVMILLDHSLDNLNRRTNRGATPLYVASHNGHLSIVKYLIKYGADINLKFPGGTSPYDIAVAENKQDVASYLKNLMSG